MARAQDPDSGSSQFFIVQADSTFLDGDYAGFGHVTEGMDIVDKICEDAKPTDDNGTISKEEQACDRESYDHRLMENLKMLEGKTVLLGVTGSIAAYKIASLASALKKRHADVHVFDDRKRYKFYQSHYF